MEPTDSCSNTPPSPPTSTQLWTASPIRIRNSAARPRRSLLSTHFSVEEGKVAKIESLLSADGLSKSLPSPCISAFLDKQEEEALEPTTPPSTAFFLVPPMAPRKSSKHRPPPRGKHKPRRLLFSEGDANSADEGGEAGSNSSQLPSGTTNNGTLTPPHQSFNSFSMSPSSTANPPRRIRMRDLR
ncbi:hypothetical protein GOP47_0027974 [Adiantum capillus-veneris]|nr:hypothetical protein GOP47_0027974 [Adiantum capillus-veneris]